MAHKTLTSITISGVLCFICMVAVSTSTSGLPSVDPVSAAQDLSLLRASVISPDEANVHYETGINVVTVLDLNYLNMSIHSTLAVPSEDFLYAMDSTASQLLRIPLPINQDRGAEVARRIAGGSQGRTGYIDGWGEDSLLDHPKGMAIDGGGNVYVADVRNRVIRKITPAGYVTTLAGQHNKTGHANGEGRNALFSANFDLTYLPTNCSLLISDRGNRRLRMIQLKPMSQCHSESSVSRGNPWKIVSLVFAGVVGLLITALGKVELQKRELQQSAAASRYLEVGQDDESELPSRGNGDGVASNMPLLNNAEAIIPLLANSEATRGRGRSQTSDLMDFSECPSPEREHGGPTIRLANSAADSSRGAENDFVLSVSSSSEDGDGTTTPERVRVQSLEHNLLSDSESMSTGPNVAFSRHLHSNLALPAPAGRSSIDNEMDRNLHLFNPNNSQ